MPRRSAGLAATGASVKRRPIEDWERPHLERFGALLKRYRNAAGLTLEQMRLATGVSLYSWFFFEHADRRPRHSTIRRGVRALVNVAPSIGSEDEIVAELIAALGPVHATESRRMEKIEKQRDRNVGKLAKNPQAVLRPPPAWRVDLERRLRFAERDLYELRRQRREVEAKEAELRRREAALERLDRQVQQRELALSQRRQDG